MKKKKLKAIKSAALEMKQTAHKVRERVIGSDILALNPDAMCNGEPVNKNKYYMREVVKPTSTYRALKKYFKNPANKKVLDKIERP